jgi:hypothetical protein
MGERFDNQREEGRSEFGEILMHADEARAIFQTELMRQIFRRGVAVENLQPSMVPALIEANMDAMLTVLAENNHRIVDLLYRMGLITFTDEEAPSAGAAEG